MRISFFTRKTSLIMPTKKVLTPRSTLAQMALLPNTRRVAGSLTEQPERRFKIAKVSAVSANYSILAEKIRQEEALAAYSTLAVGRVQLTV